jgi:putative endonuclease
MYYTYILLCSDKKIYKGSTSDLRQRFHDHSTGHVKSTRNKLPVKLIYYQAFISKKDALIEEKYLKDGKGREQLKIKLKNSLLS